MDLRVLILYSVKTKYMSYQLSKAQRFKIKRTHIRMGVGDAGAGWADSTSRIHKKLNICLTSTQLQSFLVFFTLILPAHHYGSEYQNISD